MKNTKIYHELVQKMREFFLSKNFIEVPTQSRLSILAACENPHSVKHLNMVVKFGRCHKPDKCGWNMNY